MTRARGRIALVLLLLSAATLVPAPAAAAASFRLDATATPLIAPHGVVIVSGAYAMEVDGGATRTDAGMGLQPLRFYVDGQLVLEARTGATGAFEQRFLGPTARGLHEVEVVANEGSAQEARSAKLAVRVAVAPSAPASLAAQPVEGDFRARLTWQPPLDAGDAPITAYVVERATTPGAWTQVATTSGDTFEHEDAIYGAPATYRVRARNLAGLGPAAEAIYAPDVPGAPVGLSVAERRVDNMLVLSWSRGAGVTQGYLLVRSREGSVDETLSLPGHLTSYDDAYNRAGAYSFTLRALNAGGEGPAAATSIGVSAPAQPVDVQATLQPYGNRVTLAWSVGEGATPASFRVERWLPSAGIWVLWGSVAEPMRGFIDESASDETTYEYRVVAVDGALASDPSPVLTVIVPADPVRLVMKVEKFLLCSGTSCQEASPGTRASAGGANGLGFRIAGDLEHDGEPAAGVSLHGRLDGFTRNTCGTACDGRISQSWDAVTDGAGHVAFTMGPYPYSPAPGCNDLDFTVSAVTEQPTRAWRFSLEACR